jgi:hypothetical protein
MDHEGLIISTSQAHSAGEFVRAIRRIDRQFSPAALRNTVVWLEDWL